MRFLRVSLQVFLLLAASLSIVSAQQSGLTKEERQAVQDMRERYSKRIAQTGKLESVVPDILVADFVDRWIKGAKQQYLDQPMSDNAIITFAAGLDYSKKAVYEGDPKDWKELYLATYDFMRVAGIVSLNEMAKVSKSDKHLYDAKIDAVLDNVYPGSVKSLFANDPILSDYINSDGRPVPMATAADVARVAKTMRHAVELMDKELGGPQKFSPGVQAKIDQKFRESDDGFEPRLAIADSETFGFPKGTRLISFFASPFEQLVIVKIGSEYKLVGAAINSPD